MHQELLAIVDAVFAEYIDNTHIAKHQAGSEPSTGAEPDSEWHDVDPGLYGEEAAEQEVAAPTEAIGTFIPESANIGANLQFTSSHVEIHGIVTGHVEMPAASHLVIGKRAMLTGDLHCNQVTIHGMIAGNINADRVELRTGASVQGDVRYTTSISMDDGAEICGRIQKQQITSKRIN